MDRTEELGLAAILPIQVGGQRVELRTLNLDESEKWQAKLAAAVAKFDLPEGNDAGALFATLARQPLSVMFDLVTAYDLDKKLGTPASLKKRFTQRELYDAVKQMTSAEFPFLPDLHSAAEAFGPQLRVLVSTVMYQLARQSQAESFSNGASPTGDSTPELSEPVSLKKAS